MDGFHFDDAVLAKLGRSDRKGAPDTFDVGALAMTLDRLAKRDMTEEVTVPVFDRTLELSRANARLIDADTRVLLVEGNYLLLQDAPWSQLRSFFDMTVMIASDEETLRERLLKRWTDLGFSAEVAAQKVEGNDLPNARYVLRKSAPAAFRLVQT